MHAAKLHAVMWPTSLVVMLQSCPNTDIVPISQRRQLLSSAVNSSIEQYSHDDYDDELQIPASLSASAARKLLWGRKPNYPRFPNSAQEAIVLMNAARNGLQAVFALAAWLIGQNNYVVSLQTHIVT